MKLDCYAVLGLSPAVEDVVIRAAYLALMRSYHPDKNGSAEAAARAQAITEAYKTIGDPARRAEYDAVRSAHIYEILGFHDAPEPPPRQWPKLPEIHWPKLPAVQWPRPQVMGAVAASALAIVLALMVIPTIQKWPAETTSPQPADLSPEVAIPANATQPRKAEEGRQSERIAPAPPPIVVKLPDKAVAIKPEPDRPIASKPVTTTQEKPPKPTRTADLSLPSATARPAPPKPPPVDEKSRVTALESMSTSFYNQSVSHADEARRSQLQQARDLFVNARNACRSDTCIGDAHASYIRDISRIMKKP